MTKMCDDEEIKNRPKYRKSGIKVLKQLNVQFSCQKSVTLRYLRIFSTTQAKVTCFFNKVNHV